MTFSVPVCLVLQRYVIQTHLERIQIQTSTQTKWNDGSTTTTASSISTWSAAALGVRNRDGAHALHLSRNVYRRTAQIIRTSRVCRHETMYDGQM